MLSIVWIGINYEYVCGYSLFCMSHSKWSIVSALSISSELNEWISRYHHNEYMGFLRIYVKEVVCGNISMLLSFCLREEYEVTLQCLGMG